MTAELAITNGTTTVSLINGPFHLRSWRSNVIDFKGGGVFADSPLSSGRKLAFARYGTVRETLTLSQKSITADAAAFELQELAALLGDANNYWLNTFGGTPVYLKVKSSKETNPRYAHIILGKLTQHTSVFETPFLQHRGSATRSVPLIIERGHWTEEPPGSRACTPLRIRPDLVNTDENNGTYLQRLLALSPIALWPINETSGTTAINYSNIAGLDGTHENNFTLNNREFPTGDAATFYSTTATDGNTDIYSAVLNSVFNKDRGTVLIWIYIPTSSIWTDANTYYFLKIGGSTNEIEINKDGATANALRFGRQDDSRSLDLDASMDSTDDVGRWIEVVATWDGESPTPPAGGNPRKLRLYIDGERRAGVAPPERGFPGPNTEVLNSNQCNIGNRGRADTVPSTSDQAYCVVWDRDLSQEEVIALPKPYWFEKSVAEIGDETSCADTPVFLTNKETRTQVTHIFTYDDSLTTWSSNLVDETDFDLFTNPMGVSDQLYIGVSDDTNRSFEGPFSSLVFDIGTATGSAGSFVWAYSTSAGFTTLTAQTDLTDDFRTPGVNIVTWDQISDFDKRTENGVEAWWIRVHVNSVPSSVPAQQNRPIYIPNKPFIELNTNAAGGDVDGGGELVIENVSDSNAINSLDKFANTRLMIAKRSLSRGYFFTSRINLADQQNPPNITLTAGAKTSFVADLTQPTGRRMDYTTSAQDAVASRALITVANPADFGGKFRAFLRATSSSTNTFEVKLVVTPGGETDLVTGFADITWIDLGEIDIPGFNLQAGEAVSSLTLDLQAGTDPAPPGSDTLNMYELILMPTDEWVATLYRNFDITTNVDDILGEYDTAGLRSVLEVGGLTVPKDVVRANLKRGETGRTATHWVVQAPGELTLPHTDPARFYFLGFRQASVGEGGGSEATDDWGIESDGSWGVKLYKNARYLTIRGAD
jgi:hypothetical protein